MYLIIFDGVAPVKSIEPVNCELGAFVSLLELPSEKKFQFFRQLEHCREQRKTAPTVLAFAFTWSPTTRIDEMIDDRLIMVRQ